MSVEISKTNNNIEYKHNKINKNNKNVSRNINNKNVNFTGVESMLDATVMFWNFVDSGGRALQFTVEDMCGTNFPRSYKGLTAGKKYTGKYNWSAFFQEAIREFLTGPTMTFFPIFALFVSKKLFGPSANIKNQNIVNLSNLMQGVKEGTKDAVQDKFYTKVVEDLLDKTLSSSADNKSNITADVENLTGRLKEYSSELANSLKKGEGATRATRKAAKERMAQIGSEIQSQFEQIIKERKANYSDTNFMTAKFTIDSNTKSIGEINFKDYVNSIASYFHDFSKHNVTKDNLINTGFSAIQNFKNNYTGKRMFTIFNMIVLTGILMSQIPKLYTKASGKINPNASTIYDEAKKSNKETKNDEVKNDTNKDNKKEPMKSKALSFGGVSSVLNKFSTKVGSAVNDSSFIQKILNHFDPNGFNNTFLTLCGLMTTVVLIPRVSTAAKRNPDNKEATKDEITEILFRDVTTCATILFALKILNSIIASGVGKASGLPMTNIPRLKIFNSTTGGFKGVSEKFSEFTSEPVEKLKIMFTNFKNLIHPIGGKRALTGAEFATKYSGFKDFNQIDKMFKSIDSQGGDTDKIIKNYVIKDLLKKANVQLASLKTSSNFGINKEADIKNVESIINKLNDMSKESNLAQTYFANNGKKMPVELRGIMLDLFKNPDNKLVVNGRRLNGGLRTAALAIESLFLGFGLPALNQRRLENKYLNGNKNIKKLSKVEKSDASVLKTVELSEEEQNLFKQFV